MSEGYSRKIIRYGKKISEKYPPLRPLLKVGSFLIPNKINNSIPRFSGWGMTSMHELPWNDDYQGEVFRKTSQNLKKFRFVDGLFGFDATNIDELLWRHWNISYGINYVMKFAEATEYNFVECGVADGWSSFFALREIMVNKQISSNFSMHLYDSWKPMKKKDMIEDISKDNEAQYQKLDINRTKQNLKEFKEHLVFHDGYIPESLLKEPKSPETVVYLHIDLNSAKPTLDALKFFYPKVVHGSIIIFDDYGHSGYKETKMVIDEFFYGKPGILQKLPTGQAIYYHR